jgi:TetR/AcrR family transcriptional regulator, transcriptional repressor for nem operon
MDHLEEPYPGCLFATLIYESPLLDPETMALARDTFADWRASFGARLREVDGLYPLPSHLFPEDLADMFQSVVEGGLIMARIMEDPRLLARQVGHYRSFLELAFGGASSPRGSRAPKPT